MMIPLDFDLMMQPTPRFAGRSAAPWVMQDNEPPVRQSIQVLVAMYRLTEVMEDVA